MVSLVRSHSHICLALELFALTTVIRTQDGTSALHEGWMQRLPPELISRERLVKYVSVREAGWCKDDLGYSIYSRFDFDGDLIIVPGLIIEGERGHRRIHGYTQAFSRNQIESYVDGVIAMQRRSFEKASENVNMLVHDLRNISGSIYNAALEAETFVNRRNLVEASVRIHNIIAAQSLLKIRTDVLDFLGNPASIIRARNIEVYRKVDKVCRMFKPKAQERGVQISLSGGSYMTTEGPEVFEIVPYVLVDNAIKYSPLNGNIEVGVEDDGRTIFLSVTSFGPRIMPHEQDLIFEKGVRGEHATRSTVPGSGLGLFLIHQMVVDHFQGIIHVVQDIDAEEDVEGRRYVETTFLVSVPVAQVDLEHLTRGPRIRD